MQNRYTSESIFKKAMSYIPKTLSKEMRCLAQLMQAENLKKFASLSSLEQQRLQDAADKVREALLMKLQKEHDQFSDSYIIIHDALRLLAHYFPRNIPSVENKQYVECPQTLSPLKDPSQRFIAADGYWFSLNGLFEIRNLRDAEFPDSKNSTNPYTTQEFTQQDLERIQWLEKKFELDQRNFTLSNTVFFMIGGMLGVKLSPDFSSLEQKIQFGVSSGLLLSSFNMFTRYQYQKHALSRFLNTTHDRDWQKKRFFDSLSPLTIQAPPKETHVNSLRSKAYALKQMLFANPGEEKKETPLAHSENRVGKRTTRLRHAGHR